MRRCLGARVGCSFLLGAGNLELKGGLAVKLARVCKEGGKMSIRDPFWNPHFYSKIHLAAPLVSTREKRIFYVLP